MRKIKARALRDALNVWKAKKKKISREVCVTFPLSPEHDEKQKRKSEKHEREWTETKEWITIVGTNSYIYLFIYVYFCLFIFRVMRTTLTKGLGSLKKKKVWREPERATGQRSRFSQDTSQRWSSDKEKAVTDGEKN